MVGIATAATSRPDDVTSEIARGRRGELRQRERTRVAHPLGLSAADDERFFPFFEAVSEFSAVS